MTDLVDGTLGGLRVFVSYRRQDTPGYAGRLYDRLVRRLGPAGVFMDIDDIDPGTDFADVIHAALADCDVLLALIGPNWSTSTDLDGHRRLDNTADFVRKELEAAFDRDIPVIPVLVQAASMPSSAELPQSLSPLGRRQAFELSDRRWDADIRGLISELERFRVDGEPAPAVAPDPDVPAPPCGEWRPGDRVRSPAAGPKRRQKQVVIGLSAGAVALAILIVLVLVPNASTRPFKEPVGVAVAPDGTVYIADARDNSIRRLRPDGTIDPFAGPGQRAGNYGDGGPARGAEFAGPRGIAVAANGAIYIADYYHSAIRRIAPDRTVLSVAGTYSPGFSGDEGQATKAKLGAPAAVASISDGIFYIADQKNNRIRRVAGGVITTVAGTGRQGFSGDDGPATEARLSEPEGIALAPDGTLYISDTGNHRIRKVVDGTITTVAGNGEDRFSGEREPALGATLNQPKGLAVAADGSVFVADAGNNRVRHINSDGTITTVAGDGEAGFGGDGGQGSQASLNAPQAVALSSDGSLYIADTGNKRIRRVAAGIIATVA
jgi:sugar lactone lactonase YvrE